MFETYDKGNRNALEVDEFADLLNGLYGNVRREETEILFNSVDKSGNGTITLTDLKEALSQELSLSSKVVITYKDICTPLATTIKSRLQ